MSSRVFTIEELEDRLTDEYRESRGSGRWTEIFDVVFRAEDDGKLYHVLVQEGLTEHQDIYGVDSYPDARITNAGGESFYVVECPEVELYETMRPVTLFRKVAA